MTKIEEQRAQEEYVEIIRWSNERDREREDELKKNGQWEGGFGTDHRFDDIKEETGRRLKALAMKYGLPYGEGTT